MKNCNLCKMEIYAKVIPDSELPLLPFDLIPVDFVGWPATLADRRGAEVFAERVGGKEGGVIIGHHEGRRRVAERCRARLEAKSCRKVFNRKHGLS